MNHQVVSTRNIGHKLSDIVTSLREKMRGRLSYVYRLCAAKLIIYRLRAIRYYRQFLALLDSAGVTGRWILGGVAAGCVVSAVVGYLLGTQKQPLVEPASQSLTYAPPAKVRQREPLGASFHGSTPDVLELAPPTPVLLSSPEPDPSPVKNPLPSSNPATDTLAANSVSQSEIDYLRNTVGELTRKVNSLEEETFSLESELLEQQLSFSSAEQQWNEQQVETRVVYNITNVPVGGYVASNEQADYQETAPASYVEQDTYAGQDAYASQEYEQSYVLDETYASTESEEDIDAALTRAYEEAYDAIQQLGGDTMSLQDYNASVEYTAQPYNPGAMGAGAAERWAIDGYIDGVGNGLQVNIGRQGVTGEQEAYPYSIGAEEGYPSEGSYGGQSSFYGPAEHRYEDLILPGYEATPEQARQYNMQ